MSTSCNCNSIYKIWHAILYLFLQNYVHFLSIRRYTLLRHQMMSYKFGIQWDTNLLNVYLGTIVSSIFLEFLCLYSLIFKTGHFANDDSRLLRLSLWSLDRTRFKETYAVDLQTSTSIDSYIPLKPGRCLHSILLPFSCILHLISAYILMIPIPWIVGEQLHHGLQKPSDLWQTDLAFLFPPRPLNPRSQSLTHLLNGDKQLVANLLALQPPSLGGLGQWPQTNEQLELANSMRWSLNGFIDHTNPYSSIDLATARKAVSIEFMNFVIAGLILSCKLPAIFWRISISFTLLTSFLIALSVLHLAFDFATLTLVIKITTSLRQPSEHLVRGDLVVDKLRSSAIFIQSVVHLPAWLIMCLTLLAFVPTVLNLSALYAFGIACLESCPEKSGPKTDPILTSKPVSVQSGYSLHQSLDNFETIKDQLMKTRESRQHLKFPFSKYLTKLRRQGRQRTVCLSAFGISCCLLSTSLRIPVQYSVMQIYWNNGDPLCLASIGIATLQFICWFLAWFYLAIKNEWIFEDTDDQMSFESQIMKNPQMHYRSRLSYLIPQQRLPEMYLGNNQLPIPILGQSPIELPEVPMVDPGSDGSHLYAFPKMCGLCEEPRTGQVKKADVLSIPSSNCEVHSLLSGEYSQNNDMNAKLLKGGAEVLTKLEVYPNRPDSKMFQSVSPSDYTQWHQSRRHTHIIQKAPLPNNVNFRYDQSSPDFNSYMLETPTQVDIPDDVNRKFGTLTLPSKNTAPDDRQVGTFPRTLLPNVNKPSNETNQNNIVIPNLINRATTEINQALASIAENIEPTPVTETVPMKLLKHKKVMHHRSVCKPNPPQMVGDLTDSEVSLTSMNLVGCASSSNRSCLASLASYRTNLASIQSALNDPNLNNGHTSCAHKSESSDQQHLPIVDDNPETDGSTLFCPESRILNSPCITSPNEACLDSCLNSAPKKYTCYTRTSNLCSQV